MVNQSIKDCVILNKERIHRAKIQIELLTEQLEAARIEKEELELLLSNSEKARVVVQKVSSDIQKSIENRIAQTVTLALASVFDDPYEFKIRFVERRNQTECDMLFMKDDNECDPMDSSGGGALDIASLALRMAIWSIKKTRAIQILDEPMRFLSRDMQYKGSQMIKMLSEKLGIQIIMVSHIPEAVSFADRVINIYQSRNKANIKII